VVLGTTAYFALDVFLREGERVSLTHATTCRVEALGCVRTSRFNAAGVARAWDGTWPASRRTPP
jgi:hypothetical protein